MKKVLCKLAFCLGFRRLSYHISPSTCFQLIGEKYMVRPFFEALKKAKEEVNNDRK